MDEIPPLKDKLINLLVEITSSSKMGKANSIMVSTLGKSLISGLTDAEILEGIKTLRDKIIPWLLGDYEAANKA